MKEELERQAAQDRHSLVLVFVCVRLSARV
jgi:hypothetical protein